MPLAYLSGDMILSVEGFIYDHRFKLCPILGAPIGLRIEIAAPDDANVQSGEGAEKTIHLHSNSSKRRCQDEPCASKSG